MASLARSGRLCDLVQARLSRFLERCQHFGWLQGQAARPAPLSRLVLRRCVGLRLPMLIRHGG
ncbi:hypothetical protein PybrP1_005074 [[Pythium] brassicae (nom. inval.)]|nr:hypothetical protein PybrP1_005074 [[Pythium] brassicae (nom. inval.)]